MSFEPLKLRCPECKELIDVNFYTCPNCGCDVSCVNSFMTVELRYNHHCGGKIRKETREIRNDDPIESSLLKSLIEENDADYMEVYNTQCEYAGYLTLKELIENPINSGILIGLDEDAGIRFGSGFVYLINNEYLGDLTEEDLIKSLKEDFTISDIESFMDTYFLDFESDSKEELIEYILDNDTHKIEDYLFDRYTITEKGLELLEDLILKNFDGTDKWGEYYFLCKKEMLEL